MASTSSRRTGLKAMVASAGAVALMSTGVAFAASGHAPWAHAGPTPQAADHSTAVGGPPTKASHGPESESTDDSDGTTGPNAHAFHGLCRAYASGNKTEHGHALESPPFVALVKAAGGADQVTAFCATLATQHSAHAHPSHPAHPTHPASPTHPAHPASPAHPDDSVSPTHPTHPASPTHPVSPTHPTHTSTHATGGPNNA